MIAPDGTKVIRGSTCTIWLSAEGILCFNVDDGSTETLATAEANCSAAQDLVGPGVRHVLVDMSGVRAISREAREAYSDDRLVRSSAAAIIVGSNISRVLANFFIGFNKAKFPRRVFTNETEALKWLRGLGQ
jgi:hypothetical protein